MDIKKEIESCIDACNECEEKYVTSKNYGDALYIRGVSYAYERVLRLLEEQEQEKAFSWGNVNLGDEVEYGNGVHGKVIALIYTEKGFSGMRIQYKDCTMNYGDNEYKNFKRIGDWINKGQD